MRPPLAAAACDLTAIVVFVTIGLFAHRGGLSATGYARDVLPLAAGWFAAGALFHLYSTPRIGALAATWALGITAGVLLRALVLGHRLDGGEAAFLLVCLGTIGLLVAALRGALVLARRRARADVSVAPPSTPVPPLPAGASGQRAARG